VLAGSYAGALVLTGVLAATGFGGGTAAVASPRDRTPGRQVGPAPVVPVEGSPTLGTSGGWPPPPAVPSASLGREVAAEHAVFAPTRVVLPDGTAAPVVPVGLHADGALVIPDDVRTVGWWTGGSKAGEAFGSVVVAGHVDSAAQGIGVFAALRRLTPGQVVELEGNGHVLRYRITSATQVPQAEISSRAGIFSVDGEPRLVLVTCGGPFDRTRHRYQDNLVVVATPPASAAGS
jgi:LPXTG-site transpeptidase (sortase) family protein